MSVIDKSQEGTVQAGTFANKWYHHAKFKPVAATVAGDVVRLPGVIPAGTKLLDAVAFVEDAAAGLTLSLGFDYVGGQAGDDSAYFFNAKDVAAGGKFRADANKPPLVLQYDAYLIATLGGAVFAVANQLDVVVDYDFTGPITQPA